MNKDQKETKMGTVGSELGEEELLGWLEKNLNRACMLQASHPHLAWTPTEEDKQTYQQIKKLIEDAWANKVYGIDTINELQKQLDEKKTVSREFIIKYRSKIPLHISSYHDKPVKEILSCADTALTLMLEELGYRVEEK